MFEHRQGLAAIQLHGELGRQRMKARIILQRGEDLPRQWAGVEQHLRVDTGAGAEHQVAHVVTGGVARAQARSQQHRDQGILLGADPANLQVGAVGRLDHPAGIGLGRVSHGVGLGRADRTAGQLDPANAAIQRLDNTQQPRTSRGAQGVQGGRWVHGATGSRVKARYYACFVRRHEKPARRMSFKESICRPG